MLIEALFPLLLSDVELMKTLKGGIHQVYLPEGICRPVMSYQSVGGATDQTLTSSGLNRARVQFDAFGTTRRQAAAALDLLRKFLDGYQGTLESGLYIDNAELINPEPVDYPIEEYPRDFRCMSEYYFYFTFNS